MRIGDDALEQRQVQEIAFDGVRRAERIGERLGALDAAVVHRAIEFFALHREAGAGPGERLARRDMRVDDLVDRRAAPEAHVTRLIAAGDEDAVGLAQPVEDLLVGRLRTRVEDEDFDRLDAADVAIEFLADFLAVRRAEDDDVALAGLAEEPLHRVDIPVASAHQQQPARYRTRRRRVQRAIAIMFVGLILRRRRKRCGEKERGQQHGDPFEQSDRRHRHISFGNFDRWMLHNRHAK